MLKQSAKRLLMATASIGCLLPISATSVMAQDDDRVVVEEIVVTARRRSESLQSVPGTVNAITETTLESAGVARAEDFIGLTPGITMVNAAEVGDTQVNIRGINGARDAENSFAYILDGVLYTNPAAFNREYTNLQQIEIFKGPQGAIYGRNAAAGAIIVNTAKPTQETDARATFSIAGDNTTLSKASFSGGLTDDVAFRISADHRKSDGFYRNSFQDGAAIVDAYEGYNINGRLLYEPNSNFSLDTKIRYGRVDASSITFNSTFKLPIFAGATGNPPASQDVNDYDFQFHPNITSDNDQKSVEFSSKFDYETDNMTVTGWVLFSDIQNNLIADGSSAAFGFYNNDSACQASVAAQNAAGQQLLAPQFIGEIPVGVIFAPNGSFLGAFTSTTCDGIQEQLRNQEDFSAELRFASNGDGPMNWMAGGYFLDIDRQVGVSLNRDSGMTPNRGLYQASGPNATASLAYDDFDSRVFAVFAAVDYDVSDAMSLSLALRYDNEKRQTSSLVPANATQSLIDLNFDGVFNDPLNPGLSSLINSTGTLPDKEATFSAFEPKVSATYDWNDDLTLFASWGVGFKAGGFNNSGSAATVGIFNNGFIDGGIGINFASDMGVPLPVISDDYGKETSSAFETGFKANLFDGRLQLNGAGYYTSVKDMQFFEFYVGSFGLLRVVSNMDKVDIYGLELGATAHISNNLRMYVAGNLSDSEIKGNSSRPDTVGNKAPYTPDYTLNAGFDFNMDMGNDMEMFGRLDAQMVGKTWFHTVQEGLRPTIFQPLFELGFGAGAGALGTADYSNAQRDAYMTLNARIGFGKDNWKITGFVSNLTDEKYLEEVIPSPEFGGSFDHPGAGRRYGIEFSVRF